MSYVRIQRVGRGNASDYFCVTSSKDFAGQSFDSQEFSVRHVQVSCCYVVIIVVQVRNNVQESAVRAAEEPLWVFEETLPLTPEERKTDAEKQKRDSHR